MVNDVGFHVLPMLERERVAEDELDGDHLSSYDQNEVVSKRNVNIAQRWAWPARVQSRLVRGLQG